MKARATALVLVALALLLALGILLAPAEAQQAGKMWRIAWLGGGDPNPANPFFQHFKHRLASHGYIEGQNVEFLFVSSLGNPERASQLVGELLAQKPDVLVATAPPAAHAAKAATTTIPVVFVAVGRAVQTGLVPNLAHPGENVTGLSLDVGPEIHAKQLQLLSEVVGRLSRVSVLWNPDNRGVDEYLNDMTRAAQAAHAQLQSLDVRSIEGLERAFQSAVTTTHMVSLCFRMRGCSGNGPGSQRLLKSIELRRSIISESSSRPGV